MSKLLSLAKANVIQAENARRNAANDDIFLDICCYELQQAIELSLKYLVEISGGRYAENHDIRANLNKLQQLQGEVPYVKELRYMASTLYAWETESRYKESFTAVMQDVEDAFVYARALIEYCESRISESSEAPMEEFPEERLS